MFGRTSAALVAVVAGVLVAAGVLWMQRGVHPSAESGACRGCNLLLVTIDTLRVDRVGAFGGRGGLTPAIDRLAGEGIRLTDAYTSVPLTLPSHTTILTGLEPPSHGVRTNGLFRLGASVPTLATMLKSAGYRTGAFVGAFVLDARFGLNRGFDVYDDHYGDTHLPGTEGAERRAEDVVKPALAWIENGASDQQSAVSNRPESRAPSPGARVPGPQPPFFAWLHFYDPHEPYQPPAPYGDGREPYDGEVAYADAMLGRVVNALRGAGLLERTLVVVASDHGESLGEHGERTHGVFVYEPDVRVPWVIWAGARITPGEYGGLARLVDLAPTSLDLLGVGGPGTFDGRSLVGAFTGRESAPAYAYLEAMDANLTRNWAPLTAIVSGGRKVIELPVPELYDLAADRGEATNLFARDAGRARAMTSLLRDTSSRFAARAGGGEKVTLNQESRQRLQALGYVSTSADPDARTYTDADDPKRLVPVSNELNQAVIDFNAGRRQPAMETAARIMREHPSFATPYGIYASMQRDTGDLAGATRTLESAVTRGIADQTVMVVLAGYLQQAGAFDRAVGLLDAVLASHPDDADAWNSMGVAMLRTRRLDRARAAFEKVLAIDPSSATAYQNLGSVDLAGGRMTDAVDDLRRAVALDPRLFDALYNLGLALDALGRKDEARVVLERFVREAPRSRYAADIGEIEKRLAAERNR